MTERLYDADAYRFEFSATVLSCSPATGGWQVVLDRTAFFPEGGGQNGDLGTLDDATVLDTQICDGIVSHLTDAPFAVGQTVVGKVDAVERFRRMQNHSGEHIVSGIVHSTFGFENVGFHLGEREMTMDYDGELSSEDLRAVEDAANRAVWENREIFCRYPSAEELSQMTYRSKKELQGDIRIVTVDGIDTCACCAPHVKRTGEIGGIYILDSMRWKGGTRIRVRCGSDAVSEYSALREDAGELSALLSVPRGQAAPLVKKLQEEMANLRRAHASVLRENALLRLDSVTASEGNLCLILPDADADALRTAALAGREKCSGVFVCLSGADSDGYRYAVSASREGLRSRAKEINAALNGRGGGDDNLLQGRFSATQQAIRSFFETFEF